MNMMKVYLVGIKPSHSILLTTTTIAAAAPTTTTTTFVYCYYDHVYVHHHPLSIHHTSSAGSRKSTAVTDQALLIHCSAKNVLTIRHVLRVTVFCIRICGAGRRLSRFQLCVVCFG
jgi:hypothetical protein